MRIGSIIIFFVIFFLSSKVIYGQWDAQTSQYWQTKTYYNPSFVGETNNIDISTMYRIQWTGLEGAPKTTILSGHMPIEFLEKEHGVGMQLFNEKIGLYSNTFTSFQYTYKFKFKNNKTLNIGMQGSMMNIDFDANGIHFPEGSNYNPDDPSIPKGDDKTFDMSLGVSWLTPDYYIGFSVTHLLEPKLDLNDTRSLFIGRSYYLVGGCNININNTLFDWLPSVLVKSDATVTQIDVTTRFEYDKMFNGGISWRKDDGFVFLLGLKIKNIEGGYSYDLSTSEIAKASNGSHELFIRYRIPLEKSKGVGRHKSIRIL